MNKRHQEDCNYIERVHYLLGNGLRKGTYYITKIYFVPIIDLYAAKLRKTALCTKY